MKPSHSQMAEQRQRRRRSLFFWGKRAIFFKQHGPNIKVTWHSGEQSTVALLCSRSVKIIDFSNLFTMSLSLLFIEFDS
jgi:hypothetical protein